MSLQLPFRAPTFTVYGTDDPRVRDLSLAVRILDEFTEEPVQSPVRVTLSEQTPAGASEEQKPFRNQKGDYCYEGQTPGNYRLLAEPDPTLDHYFLRPAPLQPWADTSFRDLALPLGGGPGLAMTFTPKRGYPFSPGTTLAQGRVVDAAGVGVNRAVVSTTYLHSRPTPMDPDDFIPIPFETRTDREGYFVLFFRSLRSTPSLIQVKAEEGGRQAVQPVQIREREEVRVPLLQFP